ATDAKSSAIVKTILMLGENLGLDVVAEGIETDRQLEMLRSLGCKHGQGYLFSKPVDKNEAEKLLSSGLKYFTAGSGQVPRRPSEILEVSRIQ
ncbi:MAG TPA: hypothetical protein DEA22_13070, partial [Blastocatellia bacterium]|nr:hypothetical protein [Blastocatellia bacterium]